MRPRYPLEPLARVRQVEVDERKRDVVTQVQRVRHSAEVRAGKEAALADERARAESTRAGERQHLVSGRARATDLVRSADFEAGARLRADERAAALEAARRNERTAEKAEREARAELARAQARQSALGRHRQRFERAEGQTAERAAEDDALELHQHGVREGRS